MISRSDTEEKRPRQESCMSPSEIVVDGVQTPLVSDPCPGYLKQEEEGETPKEPPQDAPSSPHFLTETNETEEMPTTSTSHGHRRKPSYFNNLGNTFLTRFEHLGELSDLKDAISNFREAAGLMPRDHPEKAACLSNLSTSFITRFERLGELSDLESAISTLKEAVDLTPHGHPDRPGILNNIGDAFLSRFERLGELKDLEGAISMLKDAVDLTPRDDPDAPAYLSNLGNCFKFRFDRLGKLHDLGEAISRYRNAVDLISHDHPFKSGCINNLGNCLLIRFKRLGELSDIQEAISMLEVAVSLSPSGYVNRPSRLHNLGISFRARFERLGDPSDLEEAILKLREAVDLTPDGHPEKPGFLHNLGNALLTRFQRLTQQSDLEQAISALRAAVNLLPRNHPDTPSYLDSLGNSLVNCYERLGDRTDLEEAISTLNDAVNLTPRGHPDKPVRLNNIALALEVRLEHLGELSDLEKAISNFRDAVELTPSDHPDKFLYVANLANSFEIRFRRLGETNDLEQAISLYSHAVSASTAPSSLRFRASRSWISCAQRIRHHTLLHAYSVAISLLPQLAWIGLPLTNRYSELMLGTDLVREAAAAALDSGLPETAVEWLEQGRSIVWGELLQLRSSYDELSSTHPDQARRLHELSTALEHVSAARESSSLLVTQTQSAERGATESLEQEANKHRMLAIERDKLLQEIRGFPGFERFLLHKEFSELRASAHSGPVVMLNAAESRCDALIIRADVDHVIHVPLHNFTFKRSIDLQNKLKSFLRDTRTMRCEGREGISVTWEGIGWEFVLSPLWKCVVKPVLDALTFTTPGDLSRIYWCPIGPFVFLPIHAAGFYDTQYSQPGHKVYDFVISSYVPTLSTLAPSRNQSTTPDMDLRILVVRQPHSDGLSPLPGVNTEVEHIREVIRGSPSACATLVESSVGTVEEVLSLMNDADWVHFACHGIQDSSFLTETGLCLADRRRLKLRDIIAVSRPRGGLAFLSACQTATGDQRLSEEAIHIAAGMLFAGYGGVVGTMWSISDDLAPDVARDVYGQLFEKGTRPDYREAAQALHEAVARLRDSNVSFNEWLPFIHMGL